MFRLRLLSMLSVLGASLWMAPLAFAHAHPVTTSPANGSRLANAPSQVIINFDDTLDPSGTTVAVSGPLGQTVSTGALIFKVASPKVAGIAVNGAGPGVYSVTWRATADDDKGQTDGTFSFTVNGAGTVPAPQTATQSTATQAQTPVAASRAPAPSSSAAAPPASLPTAGGGGMALLNRERSDGFALAIALVALLALTSVTRRPRAR